MIDPQHAGNAPAADDLGLDDRDTPAARRARARARARRLEAEASAVATADVDHDGVGRPGGSGPPGAQRAEGLARPPERPPRPRHTERKAPANLVSQPEPRTPGVRARYTERRSEPARVTRPPVTDAERAAHAPGARVRYTERRSERSPRPATGVRIPTDARRRATRRRPRRPSPAVAARRRAVVLLVVPLLVIGLVGLVVHGATSPPPAGALASLAPAARHAIPLTPRNPVLRRPGRSPRPAGALPAAGPAIDIGLDLDAAGAVVPRDFLGMSFEASALSHIASYDDQGDLVNLLRSMGIGVLRFGGISADSRVAWLSSDTAAVPAWAGWTIDPGDLVRLGRLARQSGWNVLLTVNLEHFDPAGAASEVAAAKAALGPRLEAIELGNEPDSYGDHGVRSLPWGFAQYERDVNAYRDAIARVVPGIPIAGPDVSGSDAFRKWGTGEARTEHPILLTGHHYPLGCHDVPAPTIAGLLSAPIRRAEDLSLLRYMAIAQANGLPFRLDETGSVSCGGTPGISNTFASALWAVDLTIHAMDSGLAGVNFEGNVQHCPTYTPICARTAGRFDDGVLSPQPEWYAMLLTRFLEGERPVSMSVTPRNPNIDLSAFLGSGGGVHLVVVNDEANGAAPVQIRVRVGRRFTAARQLALTAPSLQSTSGVTLGGTTVSSDGDWSAPHDLPTAPAHDGAVTITVPAASAALVTLLTPGDARLFGSS